MPMLHFFFLPLLSTQCHTDGSLAPVGGVGGDTTVRVVVRGVGGTTVRVVVGVGRGAGTAAVGVGGGAMGAGLIDGEAGVVV